MENQAKVLTFKNSVKGLFQDYLRKNNLNIEDARKLIGFSRTAVSQYLSDSYSNPKNIESAIIKYLKSINAIQDSDLENVHPYVQRPEIVNTDDALGIIAVCQSCQDYSGLGTIFGRSGFGKTFTLKQYAKSEQVYYIECEDTTSSKDLVEAIEEVIGLPGGYGTISKRLKQIREFFNVNKGSLLIIDEADKLLNKYTQKKMEILRAIFDKCSVGLIIAGEPSLENMIRSYLPRFANRVDFKYSLHGISKKEVEKFLEGYNFASDAFEEMVFRGTNNKTGCFRLLDRTLKNVIRIAPADSEITLDIIKQASKMMML